MTTTNVIGFSGAMYTLWTKTLVPMNENGAYRYSYKYIKTISKDLNKALALYPDAEVNEGLKKDNNVLWTLQRVHYPEGTFQFGKYAGRAYNACEDYGWVAWYYGQVGENEKEIIKPILEAQGWGFIPNIDEGERVLNPKQYEYHLKKGELQDQARQYLEDNAEDAGFWKLRMPISIEPKRNLNLDGCITIGEITYKFPEVRKYDFCSQPILDGKAKQIKGKKITITVYEVDDLMVYVKEFKIEKI